MCQIWCFVIKCTIFFEVCCLTILIIAWSINIKKIEVLRQQDISILFYLNSVIINFLIEHNVRPRPAVTLDKGKRFLKCNGGHRCRGEKCTYAHSELEQKTWNAQLFQGKYM